MDDKWLNHPTVLKVLAVLIGLLMWAVVHFDSESPVVVTTPRDTKVIEAVQIQPEGLDADNYALRSMEPTVVRIKVEGNLSDLVSAAPEDYIVQMDVSQVGQGTFELPLKAKLPRGLKLLEISPAKALVQIDKLQTKSFDLKVITEGDPKEGFIVGEPVIKSNEQIQVTLPEETMKEVEGVVIAVNIEGADKTVIEKRARIIVYDVKGNPIEGAVMNPSKVEVEVPITQPFKKIPLQLSLMGALPKGMSMSSFKMNVDEVVIYGNHNVINRLAFYDGVNLDLSTIKESGSTKLKIPIFEGLSRVEPSEVTVEYAIVNEATRVLTDVPFSINGLLGGFEADVVDLTGEKIDISVSGAPDVLDQLQTKDIQVVADLKGLSPGKHEVELDIQLPRFVHLTNDEPVKVTFEIKDLAASTDPLPDQGNNGDDTTDNTDNGPVEEPAEEVNSPLPNEEEESGGSNTEGTSNEQTP